MKTNRILIVDDEKNIRMTITQALEDMDVDIDTAVNGEEALAKLEEENFGLLLLDLRMPGIDGIEVLEKLSNDRPDIKVILITAHGTIDIAVDAMKKGAIDFIQKPFTPEEIRDHVSRFIEKRTSEQQQNEEYDYCLEQARKCVEEEHFDAAAEHVKKAISLDSSRPEAFNFIGALFEIQGDKLEAQKNYRVALSLDGGYKPAQDNLSRSTGSNPNADKKIRIDNTTSY